MNFLMMLKTIYNIRRWLPYENCCSFYRRGVRGIISLALLKKTRYANSPIDFISNVDLVCGTSTGSIIAGALSLGLTTDEILKFYLKEIKSIFKKNILTDPNTIINPKYDWHDLDKSLNKVFGNIDISNTKIPLMINSYSLTNDSPIYFKSYKDKDILLKKCITASCSAPTYFKPCNINGDILVDGGVDTNDLSLSGYIEIKKLFPNEPIRIVRFGTGYSKTHYDIDRGSTLEWAPKILDLFLSSNNSSSMYVLNKIKNEEDVIENYDISLMKNILLDDISKENIKYMLEV